ncbi:MAG TPA: Crp/Fnr family transcriptional regulator [Candidatus Sulfotelmatobacter sp.]
MKITNMIAPEPLRTSAGVAVRNTILLGIPQDEWDVIQPHLEFVSLELGITVLRENERIENVYFINEGLASLIVETLDGRSVEVGVCGREDLVGLSVAAGLDRLYHRVVVQVPGNGFKLPANALLRALDHAPNIRRILMLRLAIRSMQMAQNTACNRLHNIKQRLARWLLSAYDRINSTVISTTHDFLARMVGTDRPSVSVALGALQRDGAISGSRGAISIVDRQRLREQACECYAILEPLNEELGLA